MTTSRLTINELQSLEHPDSILNIHNLTFLPAVYNTSGVTQTGMIMVTGSDTIGVGGTVTVSIGGITFSNTSYKVFASNYSNSNPVHITNNSVTSFTISGTSGDVINFFVIGA